MKQDEIMMHRGLIPFLCMHVRARKKHKINDGVYIVRYIGENCKGKQKKT